MMDFKELIHQLIALSRKHVDTGETDEELQNHFEYEISNEEIGIVFSDDENKVLGFIDWSWVSSPEDMAMASEGSATSGNVLYILNLVATEPGVVRKLKALLPQNRWLIGEHEGKIHAPRGLPDEFLKENLVLA